MARVHISKFAGRLGKTLSCGKCSDTINKGDRYLWFAPGFRSTKRIRCSKPTCAPKPSELDASIYSEILAAQEGAAVALAGIYMAADPDSLRSEIEGIVEDVQSAVTSVAEQYREAAESMGGAGEQMSSWADTLEDCDIMNFEPDSANPERCDSHDDTDPLEGNADLEEAISNCDECERLQAEWAEAQVESAAEVINLIERE